MKKILLIEDNAELLENTAEILTLANYEVIIAENGKVGVDLAKQHLPDLIVCDIMMPELDGYSALNILSRQQETARIPFIFLSAKTERRDIRKGMELGADDYLTKPFDDHDLLSAIETRLKKSELFKKNYEASDQGLQSFLSDAKDALHLKDLGSQNKIKRYKKKQEIFSEGDIPNALFHIKSGNIKVYRSHPDGKELITNLYKSGDYFGFESILKDVPYEETAVALDDTEVIILPKKDFIDLVFSNAEVSRTFISLLCKKVSEKEEHLVHLAYNSIRQRTAEALIKISDLKDHKEMLTIAREDLAKMVGTAPESVIRVLSDFKQEGLIHIDQGKISLKDINRINQVIRWNFAK